ncbi:MAG: prolipoprotein diacylglyceryl transferase [Arsenophonus sp.]|nr:MAG: prolipoprotein diacylglyceryl transferase [Arsenophonus sp.]
MKDYINFPNINPILISFNFFSIHWYGLMYFFGFIFALWYSNKTNYKKQWGKEKINDFLFNTFFSLVIGGRIGYILFYNLNFFIHNPIHIFKIWEGGMSFHGGLIGVIINTVLFSKKNNFNFFKISDFLAQLTPFGLILGRIGNFINGELWGKITLNQKFGMIFPQSKYLDFIIIQNNPKLLPIFEKYGSLPRHPSQLYEMFFEGFVLFIILNFLIPKKVLIGTKSSLFLIGYGFFRFLIEFFREPDFQLGLFLGLSMGQILSIPMIISGLFIYIKLKFR